MFRLHEIRIYNLTRNNAFSLTQGLAIFSSNGMCVLLLQQNCRHTRLLFRGCEPIQQVKPGVVLASSKWKTAATPVYCKQNWRPPVLNRFLAMSAQSLKCVQYRGYIHNFYFRCCFLPWGASGNSPGNWAIVPRTYTTGFCTPCFYYNNNNN